MTVIASTPGGWMAAEMAEQPERVRAALAGVREQGGVLAPLVASAREVLVLGRGSSRSAGTYAAEALRTFAGVPASTTSPAHLAWSQQRRLDGTLVVAISQSGESTEIIAAARRALELGANLVAVTNSPASELAGLAGPRQTIHFRAGNEIAVPATKSFTSSLACLLGLAMAHTPTGLVDAEAELPQLMAELLADPDATFTLDGTTDIACAGEGFAEAVGEEGAIKLRETLRIPVASFETSEFLHGSINSVRPRSTLVTVDADPSGRSLAEQAAVGAASRGAATVSIGASATSSAGRHIRIPQVPSHWVPFLAVLPIQRAAREAAIARGEDPDRPPGLSKITRIATGPA
ncbi:SIS domain-containing protein [Longivirga aurantiaca]|uniref:SIS domain-containing protein n=1 Tax=Longivirga aurantiaca TaxID=1837743 RepID=A0ABW1T0E0_9ACTN